MRGCAYGRARVLRWLQTACGGVRSRQSRLDRRSPHRVLLQFTRVARLRCALSVYVRPTLVRLLRMRVFQPRGMYRTSWPESGAHACSLDCSCACAQRARLIVCARAVRARTKRSRNKLQGDKAQTNGPSSERYLCATDILPAPRCPTSGMGTETVAPGWQRPPWQPGAMTAIWL